MQMLMSGHIKYRLATPNDISQLVAMMNAQYSRRKTAAYFDWQYFQPCYPTVLMCALYKQEVIGMFGMQKRSTRCGAIVGQAIDMLIKAKYRGREIFKQLAEKTVSSLNDLDALCVLANSSGKNACEHALEWTSAGRIDALQLSALEPAEQIFCAEDTSQIFDEFLYSDKVRTWRFDRHPDFAYQLLRSAVSSYAITKIFTDPVTGKKYGDIVYYSHSMDDIPGLQSLVIKTSRYLLGKDVSAVTTWALPHTSLFHVLSAMGFQSCFQERHFCIKVLNPKYKNLSSLESWHLYQSDSEIY
jgi:hypothetical protein